MIMKVNMRKCSDKIWPGLKYVVSGPVQARTHAKISFKRGVLL